MKQGRAAILLAIAGTIALWAPAPGASAAEGDILAVAGDGTFDFGGDGGLATAAMLRLPSDAVPLPGGGYLIADKKNNRIRRVSRTGIITTVAGTGTNGYNGDGIQATSADLATPTGVVPTGDGGFLIADSVNNRVRRVSPAGIITTVAGSGTEGYNGDGIPATSADLDYPARVALTADGGFLIADFSNNRVRKVSKAGIIRTVAGNGTAASGGDDGPATEAEIYNPSTAVPTANGGILISEPEGHRIRRVSPSGIIRTVAGTGSDGFSGDGGAATNAMLNYPTDAEPTLDGGFLIADYINNRVRKVSRTGVIRTVAGTGADGDTGDGGPATAATLDNPTSARPTPDGGFVLTDFFNDRVRRVAGASSPRICGGSKNVIAGTAGANTLRGSRYPDAILGRGGRDKLFGQGARDCLLGGGGADRLAGGTGRDLLRGGPGRDRLKGGGRADRLVGGGGPDILRCGKGADLAVAGPGDTVAGSCERVR